MNKRIVILNQWFDPEPTFKGLLFAKELQSRGYTVEVVTGFPNYPGGKVYSGYKLSLYKKEVVDGIKIHRVYLYPSHDKSKVKRILNYGSFAFFSLIFCLFFLKKPHALYVYHPPLTTGITAAILSKIKRIPFVYDIQDLWPDTLKATGMVNSSRVLNLVDKVASFVYREAKALVVLSEGFKDRLVDRGVPSDKIKVIYNWADERFIKSHKVSSSCFLNTTFDHGCFNLLYAGNFGVAQELTVLLQAAELLSSNKKIKIYLMGDGQEKGGLIKEVADKKLENVTILNSVPLSDVSSYLNSASALFIHLKKDPLFEITIPGKTQAYMAAGKPILMGVSGAAAMLVKRSRCGVLANPSDAKSVADAILTLATLNQSQLDEMGENGRQFYARKLSLSSGVDKFSDIFESL